MAGVARRHPQITYTGHQNSLQHEWNFVHRVTPSVGEYFRPVEESLQKFFLPDLFHGSTSSIWERVLARLLVNQAKLITPNPTLSTLENWTDLCVIARHLATALRGRIELGT